MEWFVSNFCLIVVGVLYSLSALMAAMWLTTYDQKRRLEKMLSECDKPNPLVGQRNIRIERLEQDG